MSVALAARADSPNSLRSDATRQNDGTEDVGQTPIAVEGHTGSKTVLALPTAFLFKET